EDESAGSGRGHAGQEPRRHGGDRGQGDREMSVERPRAIIKPDAVAAGAAGKILGRIEQAGFKVVALKMIQMSFDDAAGFYAVHRERPFFKSLCTFMTQGPCIPMVLEADDAIQRWRDLMGATDPVKAAAGTIRKDFATS